MKSGFTDEWIAALNAQYGADTFVKAMRVDDPVAGNRYFSTAQREIVFDGQTYTPLPMSWQGGEVSSGMSLPVVRVSFLDLTGAVEDYLEIVSLLGRTVELMILNLSLLEDPINVDALVLQLMAVSGHLGVVTFTLGLNLALDDMLPKYVISSSEFPAIPSGMRRASLL
jgi:hypothetical protein